MPQSKEAVTAAEIIRNFGFWQQQALIKPVTITHHGRARVMLISIDEHERLTAAVAASGGAPAVEQSSGTGAGVAVLDNMAEGFVLFDRDLRVVQMNRVAEAYYGVDREMLAGKTIATLFPQTANSVANEWIARVQRTGEIATFEMTSSMFADRRLSVRVFPCRDMTALLFLNITEQEHLRDQTVEWRAARQAIRTHEGISLITLDSRGKPIAVDAEFTRLTGFEAAGLAQSRIFDIVAPGSRRRLQQAFEDLMSTNHLAHVDVDIMVRAGGERRVAISMAPVIRDVTAHSVIVLLTALEDDAPQKS